jgi:iron complex outermembrane receptor protein
VYTAQDWLNLYASVSTSFETPTFAQLGDPSGPGINSDVSAQTSTNYEVGAKGVAGQRLRFDVSVFHIDLEDQLVPFEQNDDVFYRNAGESSRNGLEIALGYQLTPSWSANLAYTLNDFEFETFTENGVVLDGNEQPGAPGDQLYLELAYQNDAGWYAFWDVLHVGAFYADDANAPAGRVDDYRVSNLRGGRAVSFAGLVANAFLGVNNVFDADYFSNIRINQTFNRAFEPGPGRHIYGGFSVRW